MLLEKKSKEEARSSFKATQNIVTIWISLPLVVTMTQKLTSLPF